MLPSAMPNIIMLIIKLYKTITAPFYHCSSYISNMFHLYDSMSALGIIYKMLWAVLLYHELRCGFSSKCIT